MIKTDKIKDSWFEMLKFRGFTKDSIFDEGQHEDLKVKLLKIGGEAVILPVREPDKITLLTKGKQFSALGAVLKIGVPIQCHSNSAQLWHKYIDILKICTGYALSKDGVWRQHSWCYLNEYSTVVETTTKRLAYFGVELDYDEAVKFYKYNI